MREGITCGIQCERLDEVLSTKIQTGEERLKNYSIVFQDVTLFNSSVMENIRIGKEGATDEEVMEAARLIKNKTVLIIAHRMRTIANADKIVVLKDGVVAEQGSPEFLSGYDSIYSRMTKQQMIARNWKM